MNLIKKVFGTGAGDSYITNIKEKIKDQKIWRALYGGYFGKSWDETTVETDDDWYFVTKLVIHCLAEDNSPKTKYQVPTRIASSDEALGYTLEDIQRKGQKVLDEAEKLYNYALNSEDSYQTPIVTLTKKGAIYSSGENLVQDFTITANNTLNGYDVSLTGFPTGTTYTKNTNTISVKIPRANITEDINGRVVVTNAKVKTCPAFYADSTDPEFQDYVITAEPYEKASTYADIKIENKKGQIEIIKTSKDDNPINGQKAGTPIPNVKFKVYDCENKLVDEIITSEDGTATTKLLNTGCYFIKEVESGEYYLLNENIFTAEIKEHQEIVAIEITNESENPPEEEEYIQTVYEKEIEVKKLPQTGC